MARSNSYEGEIATNPERGTTVNGKTFVRFALRSGKELVSCVVWGSSVDPACNPFMLKNGAKLILRGFWGDKEPPEFIVKWFGESDSKQVIDKGWNEKLYDSHGGKKEYENYMSLVDEGMEKRGFVLVGSGGNRSWVNKKFCIKVDGKWLDRIEFVMDTLGADYVSKEIKDAGIGVNISSGSGKYNEKLNALIKRALLKREQQKEMRMGNYE